MGFKRTTTKVGASTSDAAPIGAGVLGAGSISASSMFASGVVDANAIGADAVGSSELASGAVTAAGTEIAAGGVVAGNVAVGGVSAANQFGAGVVDAAAIATGGVGAAEIAADAVAASELAGGTVVSRIDLKTIKAPSAVRLLSRTVCPDAFTASSVLLNLSTLHTANADAFAFNIRNGTLGNMFAANQVVTRNEALGNYCKYTKDSPLGNDEGTFTTGAAGVIDLSDLDTAANGDFWYLGRSTISGGFAVDTPTNDNVSVMTGKYWDGAAWSALTISDGTDVAGDSMKQSGDITFDPPANWTTKTIDALSGFWIRLQFSAALDATTTVAGVTALRTTGVDYEFTPDQNLSIASGADIRLHCTEADANAVIGGVTLEGTFNY